MPQISLIPVPLYQPLDPYNNVVDNQPIEALIERDNVLNSAVDNNTLILSQSIGTQGSLANRLAQSINDDGSLKSTAINNALHSIEDHVDTSSYVRMEVAERAKLSMITSNATALTVIVDTISGAITYDNATLEFGDSDTIQWQMDSGKIIPTTSFPASVRHTHYYGLVPVNQNLFTPNYKDYYVTSVATPYREGSLRVYVNGLRLDENGVVYVPIGFPGTVTYQALTYTENAATDGIVLSGGFSLSSAISSTTRIIIDFDVLY